LKLHKISAWLIATLVCGAALTQPSSPVAEIRELRLRGQLDAAALLAENALQADSPEPQLQLELHLELARIHDRLGLHHNSRPVAQALQQIEMAATIAAQLGQPAHAQIELALAEYHYRAEMSDRTFDVATVHAERAQTMFRQLQDSDGEAEAVHRLGLVHMQRRELPVARTLFEESMRLDRENGERLFFRGEYERHMAFVVYLEGDVSGSVPYFERSLQCRIDAGALDASLFAAHSLAAVLLELGRIEEARLHAEYALEIATSINSPTGIARAGSVLQQIP
jgi:tetratricopeptide (TPR) repeat protein